MSENKDVPDNLNERSQWLSRAMRENPNILSMRERSLARSGGMSYANVVMANTTSSLSSLNREQLLELVYQHLRSIGFNESADILEKESGRHFQNQIQPWDKTNLQLLVSLAISHREDPWNIPPDPSHNFAAEEIEEDNFAFQYREDTSKIWEELADPMINSVYTNPEDPSFKNLKYASLKRIVVSLVTPIKRKPLIPQTPGPKKEEVEKKPEEAETKPEEGEKKPEEGEKKPEEGEAKPEDGEAKPEAKPEGEKKAPAKKKGPLFLKQHLPDADLQLVFLTLHSMTSSEHLLQHFVTLFDGKELDEICKEEASTIRSNIIDVIKKWISFHGLFIGKRTLKSITQFFTRNLNNKNYSRYCKVALNDVIPNLTYGSLVGQGDDKPIKIENPELLFVPNLTLLTPDPEFVANQISTYQLNVFASVHSLEFINAFANHKTSIQTPTLNEFFQFGKHLQCLFLDAFLKEEKPEIGFAKMLRVGEKFKECHNFDALYNLVLLLRREDVKKLGNCQPEQERIIDTLWEECGKDGSDYKKNGGKDSTYDKNIHNIYDGWDSCIPNLTAELFSIPETITEQSDFTEDGLINWEKKRTIAERAHIIYRFQIQSSFPPPVSQIQKVISSLPKESFDDLTKTIAENIADMPNHK